MSEETARPPQTFYEAVGGEETFTRLVHRFYQEVAADPMLRPVYPAKDLGPAEEHLRLFLIQYWGGAPTYNALRAPPRRPGGAAARQRGARAPAGADAARPIPHRRGGTGRVAPPHADRSRRTRPRRVA